MIDQERNIIACLFQAYETQWVDSIVESVTEEMFTDSQCQRIFRNGIQAIGSHGSATLSVVSDTDAIAVKVWQRTMVNPSPSISYVHTEYKRRKIADFCHMATQELMLAEPVAVLSSLQSRLDSLSTASGAEPKLSSYYVRSLIDQLQDDSRVFINTGIADFDVYMKGFQSGQMVVIAGRPGQGKSVLASQIALTNALQGRPVLMFNLEMSGEEIVGRIISGELGINSEQIANRDLNQYQLERIISKKDIMDGVPLHIDVNTGHTINSMRSIARKYRRQHGIELIVVDYLQLIGEEKDKGENREQLVARMSRSFKILAKELEIPVIILSQLSRESDKRTTKEPQLSDLRDSGAIEQDADVVIFVHRPETHDIQTFDDGSSTAGCVVVKVAKRRNGPTQTMRLLFNSKDQRIENL